MSLPYGTDYTADGEPVDDLDGTATGDPGDTDEPAPARSRSVATRLVELARHRYRLLLGEDGDPYAVERDGPNIALTLRGRDGLRQRLARAYYVDAGSAPSAASLADALAVLDGEASECEREPVALRLARHDDGVILDLGTADGQCVQADPGGWRPLHRSPVLFRRTALTGELPMPASGGSVASLAALVNADEATVRLLVGWLVAGLIPNMPHPILGVFGEQGTAKTTLLRLLATLVDPSPAPTRTAPRDLGGWAVAASASWLVGIDNVSSIPEWFSDAMCRAVTGDAVTARALYTDNDVTVIAFRRLLAITSIDAGSLRGDLGDRLLPVELERIVPAERRTDAEISAAFADAAPAVLGVLLDLLSGVLARLPAISPADLPRMADFAVVLAALDQVTGWTTVLDYAATASEIAETVVDSDAFATAVRDYAMRHGEWTGTATVLRDALTPERPPRGWPRNPRAVSGAIRRVTPALRAVGVTVDHDRAGRDRTKVITLTHVGAADAGTSDASDESPSVDLGPGDERTIEGQDRKRDPASFASFASAHGGDQGERADARVGASVGLWQDADAHGRNGAFASLRQYGSDQRKRSGPDAKDAKDGLSHSLFGEGVEVQSGPCRLCDRVRPLDGAGYCLATCSAEGVGA